MKTFLRVLINTGVANVTTSYLWWALIFWAYVETGSVLVNGLIAGAYMLLISAFSMVFGTLVDRYRKHHVMLLSGVLTGTAFALAGALFFAVGEHDMIDLELPWFWIFSFVVLCGSVVEHMRTIALATTVTLLLPDEEHARANGLVGTVAGIGFAVTSVLSGLSVGLLGMGWTIVIAVSLTLLTLIDLSLLRLPEEKPARVVGEPIVDLAGGWAAVRAVPGLFGLIVFSTFNNLLGGVFMALIDPYGLSMFSVEAWGLLLALTSSGFIIGGLLVAKVGLGESPLRTMLLIVIATGVLGSVFTIREWSWLFVLGVWGWMLMMPVIEAAEQTVVQRVVPFDYQGRVFGFSTMFETAAAPITMFLVAPLAQFVVIPHLQSESGAASWRWLVGDGDSRGIAVMFVAAGIGTILIAVAALRSRTYRFLSDSYVAAEPAPAVGAA